MNNKENDKSLKDYLHAMVVAQGKASKVILTQEKEDYIVNIVASKMEPIVEKKLASLYKFGQLDAMRHEDLMAERVEDFKNELFK